MKTQVRRGFTGTARAALVACACAAALWWMGNVRAEAPPLAAPAAGAASERHVANLEHAFWLCDYIATTHGVAEAPVELCADVTHELMEMKFGDDFGELLDWWRENKEAEHQRLARADAGACRAPGREEEWI